MCRIDGKFENPQEVTLYKVALKHGDHYLSPCTGVSYGAKNKGVDISPPNAYEVEQFTKKTCRYFRNVVNPSDPSYNSDMVGKTGGFVHKSGASILYRVICSDHIAQHYTPVIVKCRLKNITHGGSYRGWDVLIGSHITILEECSQ